MNLIIWKESAVGAVRRLTIGPALPLPLALDAVHAGFPSPAEDHAEEGLDLSRRLIRHPSATFLVRAEGDSMEPLIRTGDLLIVDRSQTPRDRDVVIAVLGGGFAVRRFQAAARGARVPFWLTSDNRSYAHGAVQAAEDEVEVWGVVTAIVRELSRT